MRNPNDPGLVHKALAKAQSVEQRLNALVDSLTPQTPLVLYNTTSTVVSQAAGGDYTWTCPAGVTSIRVECWGAGGGGGGSSVSKGGGGGGGGEYTQNPAYPVVPGTVYTYTVGNGGIGGTTGNNGLNGSITEFDFYGLSATGGNGGAGTLFGAGATGATAPVEFAGGNGSGSTGQSTGGCGGGASGGPSAIGNSGAGNSVGATGTAGGAGAADSGAGGAGGNNGLNGVSGSSPGGGGGGCGAATGSSQVSLSYQPTSTGSYYGSDAAGGNANKQRNVNGVMYTSGETASGGTYNGTQKSLMILPSSVQADLAGVTIDSLTVRMQNQHSWYNSGLGVNIGYTPNTSLPSTWNGSGAVHTSSYHVNEGSDTTVDVTSSALGAALKSGAAKALYIGLGSAYDLTQYGYFTGAGHTFSPLVTVTGHTGAAQVQAGSGADGQVRITYTATAALVAAVQPAAGTDSFGNAFASGFTGPANAFNPNSSPQTVETWHNMTLTGGWTATAGNAQYKLMPDNTVMIRGESLTPGTLANGTSIWTIPAGYVPVKASQPISAIVRSGTALGTIPRLEVSSGGTLAIQDFQATANALFFSGSYALD